MKKLRIIPQWCNAGIRDNSWERDCTAKESDIAAALAPPTPEEIKSRGTLSTTWLYDAQQYCRTTKSWPGARTTSHFRLGYCQTQWPLRPMVIGRHLGMVEEIPPLMRFVPQGLQQQPCYMTRRGTPSRNCLLNPHLERLGPRSISRCFTSLTPLTMLSKGSINQLQKCFSQRFLMGLPEMSYLLKMSS